MGIQRLAYRGFSDCVLLQSKQIELIVPTQIGPRVLHCALPGGENVFYRESGADGPMDLDEWHPYGGHRLWHGPQVGLRPNEPDNVLAGYDLLDDGVRLHGVTEPESRMQKDIEIRLDDAGAVLVHRLTNEGVWPVRCTAWALTQMKAGGAAILPLPRCDTHYLPSYALTFWPWTRPNDPRVHYGADYLTINHDPENAAWWKIGYGNTRRWAAYLSGDTLFVKQMEYLNGAKYSDYGASCESYADNLFVEIESLSPLTELSPGGTMTLTERWRVYHKPSLPSMEALIEWIEDKGGGIR